MREIPHPFLLWLMGWAGLVLVLILSGVWRDLMDK